MIDSTSLPSLPVPALRYCSTDIAERQRYYTADQMQAYAAEAVLVERERCAQVCEEMCPEGKASNWTKTDEHTFSALSEAAAAIRKG